MRMMKLTTLILIAAFVCFSCSNGHQESTNFNKDLSSVAVGNDQKIFSKKSSDKNVEDDERIPNIKKPNLQDDDALSKRKLIKNGYLAFETDSLARTYYKVRQATNIVGGYISDETQTKHHGSNSWNVTVRVPAYKFDELLDYVAEGVWHFDQRQISTQDVTEEFVDLTARLKTKKEVEQRFIKLLDKAKNINEILDIEYKLGGIRADIESKEGRLNYLKNQVGYSTLNVKFYEVNHTVAPRKGFFYKLGQAFETGWSSLGYFVIALVSIWPLLILFVVVAIVLIRWNKKAKKRKAPPLK